MAPPTQELRVAIAGYGVVGKRRRHFIDLHPNLHTIAVCDRNFKDMGVLNDGVAYFPTPEELLTHEFDALFVCMTNDIAPDVTIAGLEKGVHVFCEKPPGRTVADIERVIKCERAHPGLKLKYGFNHRYHDSVREALAIARSGDLGRIINLRGIYGKSKFISYGNHSHWRTERKIAGGGILLDQGIHIVDLMRLFAGEFTQIHSFVSNSFWGHDVEDNAYALMKTDDGVIGMLHSSATQWRHRFNLEITLEKGALILSGILSGSKSYGAETLTVIQASDDDQGDPKEQVTRYSHDPSWADEIADFAEAIRADRPITEGSSKDALRTMQLVYRIYAADAEWRELWELPVI
ncbi:MAG: Gfo/Idh/MocA family oxidoreductase [Alphaproteobacteria bacterium]|uniref:Gfo/Idh/MocA family protein n=1 Tax=Alphaproteobacteria TaxID=28211 RepID=UPI0032652D47